MSKLILSLIGKNKSNLFARVLLSSRKNAQFRLLASSPNNQVAKPTESTKVSESSNEFDKPQWERSDRFRIFYGFDHHDEAADKAQAYYHGFIGMFFFVLFPCFVMYYYPDFKSEDWAYREAYLQIAKREQSGEPLVSPDYVPVEKIHLPSDEELNDMEIII